MNTTSPIHRTLGLLRSGIVLVFRDFRDCFWACDALALGLRASTLLDPTGMLREPAATTEHATTTH